MSIFQLEVEKLKKAVMSTWDSYGLNVFNSPGIQSWTRGEL